MALDKVKTCPKCKVTTSNLDKHLRRGRCEMQHVRKSEREAMKQAKREEQQKIRNQIKNKR